MKGTKIMGKYTDGKTVVVAKNYEEAAEKIYDKENKIRKAVKR